MKKTEWNNYWDKKINEHFKVKPAERINLREFVESVYNEKYALEETEEPIKKLVSTISSGVGGEAIYETFVYIVARLEGSEELPTIPHIKKVIQEPEIVPLGREWISNVLSSGNKEQIAALPGLVASIGADIKKLPGVKWGKSLAILHSSVDDYYKKMPKDFKVEGSKQNTADMIIVTKGTIEDVLSGVESGKITADSESGDIKAGKSVFKQVSLKKAKENARIGKLNVFINQKYGQQAMSPSKLSDPVAEGRFTDFLQGVKEKAKSAKDFVKTALSAFTSKISKSFSSLVGSAIKAGASATDDAENSEINKISQSIMSDALRESLMTEGVAMMNAKMRKELKTLVNVVIGGELVQKEYNQMMEKLVIIENEILAESGMKNPVIVDNKGTDPELNLKYFKQAASKVLKIPDGEEIPKDLLSPILKITVNYASYRTFNNILLDMLQNGSDYKSLVQSISSFAGDMNAEAKFGNTTLPLWIVYGMGGGAHNLGTRDEYAKSVVRDLESFKDDPFIVFEISKSKGKEEYNAIYMLLMSGIKEVEEGVIPVYTKIQFINRSGSNFSYKIDAMQNITLRK